MLEGQTSSEIIAYHLNSMHAARAAFVESEVSEKVRRVIRKKRGLHLRFQHVKNVSKLPECEIEDEKDRNNITTAEIFNNNTFEIYDKSDLSNTTSDTIVNKDKQQRNSRG